MSSVKNTLLLLLFTCAIAACGLRGPLYLPNEEQTSQPTSPQEAKKAQEEEKDKEKDYDGDQQF